MRTRKCFFLFSICSMWMIKIICLNLFPVLVFGHCVLMSSLPPFYLKYNCIGLIRTLHSSLLFIHHHYGSFQFSLSLSHLDVKTATQCFCCIFVPLSLLCFYIHVPLPTTYHRSCAPSFALLFWGEKSYNVLLYRFFRKHVKNLIRHSIIRK